MRYEDQLLTYQNQRLWWFVFGNSFILLIALGTIWYLTHQPRPLPAIYVPSIHGEIIGRVQPIQGLEDISDVELRHILDDYIQKAFSISTVYEENIEHQQTVADMTAGAASTLMADWWKANNPVSLGQKYSQIVKIKSRLKESAAGTYEYHWQLIRRSLNDDSTTTSDWRGELQAVHLAPTDTNDLGVFVIGFQWTQEQE